ncbi:MAG: hypothetical protein U0271_11490 [Polyangiaceae bacterium]
MPTERDYLFEERAAIIEFEGKLPREEAERLAREELTGRAEKGARALAKPVKPEEDPGRGRASG